MDKQKLQEELKQSMLAKNELKTSVLRLLLSAINYYEIQKGGAGYQATVDDILSVIQTQVKQRKDSIEQFTTAGRQELVDKETKELEILKTYLPQQMEEDEVKTIVEQTVKETGATTITDMGKVMGALGPKLKGKADMGLVSQLVKEKLS
ncbi:MAG TPA: GatB/YqeY domain-containing protein [Patescibacteria group bacterium]|nr:GatB/YqeY domain-containing protein [Patescibacteria group bacterium]